MEGAFPGLATLKRSMPLAVDSYVMGPFQSNCYVVRSERGASEAAIVDPGDDPTALRLELARMGTNPAGILVTHADVDHIGGVAALADGTGAEVWAPAGEVEALRSGRTRGGMQVAPHEPAHTVTGGDQITVAGIGFDVLDVPGHSHGHVAFHAGGEIFGGDLLFAGSVGRVDLPGGDWETLLDSLRSLYARFPAETIVHPGHGPATTLGHELQSNPFLRELRAELQP
jgi:glyoxylase-like metal-dependent hydrolase (beta-lactamase superfamily II)